MPDAVRAGTGDATSGLVVAVVDGGTAATTKAEPHAAGEIVAPTATGAPHLLQNFTPPISSIPHFVQKHGPGLVTLASLVSAPHVLQSEFPLFSATPHFLHSSGIQPPKRSPRIYLRA